MIKFAFVLLLISLSCFSGEDSPGIVGGGTGSGGTPGGAAGGALTGTYPNPTLASGVTVPTPSFTGTPTIADGTRWTFNPNATVAGLNVGAHTANPSTLVNGDLWYNSTAGQLLARINGLDITLGVGLVDQSYGDITVGAGGTTMEINAAAVGPTELDVTQPYSWTGDHTYEDPITMFQVANGGGPSPGYGQIYIKSDNYLYITTNAAGEKRVSFDAVTGTGDTLVLDNAPTIITPNVTGAIGFQDGVRQTFNPDATVAGLNVGAHTADPSTPVDGDIWYNSTTNDMMMRINAYNNVRIPFSNTGGIVPLGSQSNPATDIYLGDGISATNPTRGAIRGNGGSGSNRAGGDVVLSGGRPTGTGASTGTNITGSARIQTVLPGSSSSSLQTTELDRQWVRGMPISLSDNSATTIATMTVPTLRSGGGRIEFSVEITDGTDVQSCNGIFRFNAVNKADTFTTDPSLTQSTIVTSGTLNVTFGFTTNGGTDAVNVQITSDTSLTTTVHRVWYTVYNESGCVITLP